MKNLKKVITLMLALTMVFCLFSGFTYAPLAASSGIMVDSQPRNQTVKINENAVLGFSTVSRNDGIDGFTVEFKWYQCDDINKTNSTLLLTEKKPIISTFTKNISRNATHYFYCVATDMVDKSTVTSQVAVVSVVGATDVIPTYNIPVSVYAPGLILLNTKAFEGQALILPNAPTIEGLEFDSWTINNKTVTSPVTITSTMTNADGIVNIDAKYNDVSPKTVTYFVEKSGFLGIKSWAELTTRITTTGLKVPDVSAVVGESFDYYSLDKDGKMLIPADYVIKNDLNVYVHQKSVVDKFKVEYYTMTERVNTDVNATNKFIYTYKINQTNYSKLDTIIDLSYAPTFEHKVSQLVKTYAFDYWSFDEDGKIKVASDFVIDNDVKVYAQYKGLADGLVEPSNDKNTGVVGFFKTVNEKILKPMNAWWNIGNAWDYVITIAVLLIGIVLAIKLIVFGIKALIGFAFR